MHKLALFRIAILLSLSLVLAWGAERSQLVVTSATNPSVGVTADSLATIFGTSIATQTVSANSSPWPTSLGDMPVVWVTDAANQKQMAGILFVSPTQMNIYIPAGLVPGPATIQFPVTGLPPGAGTAALRSVQVAIQPTAPGLFSADGTGKGPAAATGIRVAVPSMLQSAVPVFTCQLTQKCTTVPIAVGLDTPVYLSLYGSGIRGAGPDNIVVTIGNTMVKPAYAGSQMQIQGLDQVNFLLPLTMRGAGTVDVTVTALGFTSNPVQVTIQ